MGDRGSEHTVPPTELEEITSKISDLNKWREIFSFHSLEISNATPQQRQGSADDGAPAAREPQGQQPSGPHSAIPKCLLVPPGIGGQPISLEMAMGLRKLLFGNMFQIFSCQWTRSHFRFREPYSDLAFALEAEKAGPRAILMAVQAHIIKYLLFERPTEHTHLQRLHRIGRREQGKGLSVALAELLWAAGGGRRAVICLVSTAIHITPSRDYTADDLTERIQQFEFLEKAAAQEFIFDHINCFRAEGSRGVILFLYSLLLSRTLERVQEDLDSEVAPLLQCGSGHTSCTQALLNLLLTGQASPHELRGGQELGHDKTKPRRCPVGYLCWGRAQVQQQVCPGLRTPQVPIWLCSLSGRHSVLFSTNSLLLSNWKAERVFCLYFYTGQQEQRKATHLTIDTHSHHWEEDQSKATSSPEKKRPALEMAVRTKWAGATINWNGTDPFF